MQQQAKQMCRSDQGCLRVGAFRHFGVILVPVGRTLNALAEEAGNEKVFNVKSYVLLIV